MKRFVAFLVIAAILGTAGFLFLGTLGTSPQFDAIGSPAPPMLSKSPAPPEPGGMIRTLGNPSEKAAQAAASVFKDAKIAFQTPGNMTLGKSREVKLVLNLQKTIEQLKEDLGNEFPTQGAVIDASPIMEASLSGGAFDIRDAGPMRQAIRDGENTTWEWSVIPREKGKHTLKLRLYAIVTLQGATAPMEVKNFERDIPVDVSVPDLVLGFVKDNIQLVWLVLVVPISGFLSRLFGKKKS